MKTESITIILPLPGKCLQPNETIGSFGGRMMKAAATKKYRRLACEAVEAEQVETMPWELVTVQANFFHACKRRRDQDNAMGSLKAAYDGIVDSGLVADDDYEHMRRGVPTFGHDTKSPRVELIITRSEGQQL
jgi:hypothetical protein